MELVRIYLQMMLLSMRFETRVERGDFDPFFIYKQETCSVGDELFDSQLNIFPAFCIARD
jgi:hypothetical protein